MLFRTNFNVSIIKHGALLALCLILFWSCKHSYKSNYDLPQITDFIVDSMYLPITENNHQKLKMKEIRENSEGRELIAFVNEVSFKLYIYNMVTGNFIDSIDVSKYRNQYVDFAPMNIDSFLIVNKNNQVLLVTKNKTKKWSADCITQKLGKYAFISYLSAEPLHVFGDTLMVTTSTSKHFPIETGPDTFFLNVNNDVLLRLYNDSVIFVDMHNPNPPYFYKQDYYANSDRAYINSRQMVYSFSHSDTIFKFNFETRKEKKQTFLTRNFEKNRPFEYSRVQDFKYIMEYEFEQSRNGIGDLYYDRFRHRIYQTLHHKGQYIDSVTGQKNKTEDIPSSIFMFDEDLNQLMEVYVPAETLAYSQFSFISKSGLYYAAAMSKQKYHDKMLFYRIVFK